MNKSCPCLNYPQSYAEKALFCKNAFIFALPKMQKLRRPKNSFCPVLFSKKGFSKQTTHFVQFVLYHSFSDLSTHFVRYFRTST